MDSSNLSIIKFNLYIKNEMVNICYKNEIWTRNIQVVRFVANDSCKKKKKMSDLMHLMYLNVTVQCSQCIICLHSSNIPSKHWRLLTAYSMSAPNFVVVEVFSISTAIFLHSVSNEFFLYL
jgi:hypothetical protein